jgi:hypothetical protein
VTGARAGGSWIHGSTWDLTAKPIVSGAVRWPQARLAIVREGDRRRITGNGLPVGEATGTFPIPTTDPVYRFDRNPNPLQEQSIDLSLPLNPVVAASPSPVELPVGIGLDGVIFFSALDSHGRDEPAYEMQDQCSGMSAPNGMYHRYLPSDCLPHARERNALVGYALDGFGIYSPFDEDGRELTTKDLDECHGRVSPVSWDGHRISLYHYVLTRDFPYSVGCFRGTPERITLPPPPFDPFFHVALFAKFVEWALSPLFGGSDARAACAHHAFSGCYATWRSGLSAGR